MDILRRNTDYALRIMVDLAMNWKKGPISTKSIASNMDIPYHLTCKLLQRLHKTKLIESRMGPDGGFKLRKSPSKINLLEIIETVQGPLRLNKCLIDVDACTRQDYCPVSKKLVALQNYLTTFFTKITLAQLLKP